MWKQYRVLLAVLLLAQAGVGARAAGENPAWASVGTTLRAATVTPSDVDIIVTQANKRGVDPATVTTWAHALLKMQQAGLPVKPGVDRIQQGLAKNIPTASINQALATLHKDLDWGKELVDARTAKDEKQKSNAKSSLRKADISDIVMNLEIARRQGFNMPDIANLLTETGMEVRDTGAVVRIMTTWRDYGLNTDFVLSSIQEVLGTDNSMTTLATLNQTVEVQAASGASVAEIASSVEQRIMNMPTGSGAGNTTSGGSISQMLGTQAPLLDLRGGACINETFISSTGEVVGSMGGAVGGAVGGTGGTGMMGGMHRGHHMR